VPACAAEVDPDGCDAAVLDRHAAGARRRAEAVDEACVFDD
jgi:hypothetical protein